MSLKRSFDPTKDFPLRNFFDFLTKKVLSNSLIKTFLAKAVGLWQQKRLEDSTQLSSLHQEDFKQDSTSGHKQTTAKALQTNLDRTNLDRANLNIAWWAWPTVLSLDAPFVAVFWQGLIADSFQLSLRPLHVLLLFATVWLIYVADRCFDSVVIDKAYTARHAFYKRHFRNVVLLAVFIASAVLVAAVRWLEPTIFLHGCLLSGVVLLYLANLHLLKTPILLLAKELQIGIVFALGTGLSLWSQLDASMIILFSLATLCFASLCFLNCSFISLWEKSVDILHQQPSLARNGLGVQKLSLLLQVAAMSLCLISLVLPFGSSLKLAFALSSLGLCFINYTKVKTSIKLKRVLADVVLMSPLLVLVFKLSTQNL